MWRSSVSSISRAELGEGLTATGVLVDGSRTIQSLCVSKHECVFLCRSVLWVKLSAGSGLICWLLPQVSAASCSNVSVRRQICFPQTQPLTRLFGGYLR